MGLFGKDETKELFYPNCRPVGGGSEGRVVLECQPKLMIGDKVLTGERPAQIIIEAGKDALVADDGGNPTPVLNRLLQHIQEARLK